MNVNVHNEPATVFEESIISITYIGDAYIAKLAYSINDRTFGHPLNGVFNNHILNIVNMLSVYNPS
jgi:hypothetical protein